MIRWKLLASGIAVILGALAFGRWQLATRTAQPRDPHAEQVEELKASVRALQKRVNAMDDRILVRQILPPPGIVVPREDDGAARPQGKETLERSEGSRELEMVGELDEKFAAQGVDATWSSAAASQLTRVLSTHLPPGSSLTRVECRKDMCRVESRHADVETYREFATSSFMSRSSGLWNGGFSSWIVDKSATGVVAVSHVAKEGQDLPNTANVPD